MAANDSALQNGTEKIATNALSTVNGTSVTADVIEVQRIKNGFGVDGAYRDVSKQFPLPVDSDSLRTVSFLGRSGTFRMPGRAGTTGQKICALYNAAGSAVLVDLEKITLDMSQTVIKAVTVIPPQIRLYRITALPTGGTALTKVARDTALTSSASVSLFQDASADGTASTVALTAVVTAGTAMANEYAGRLITAAGYEVADRIEFLAGENERITLRAGEGLVLALDYTLATQNPVTDMWMVSVKWTEYTAAA